MGAAIGLAPFLTAAKPAMGVACQVMRGSTRKFSGHCGHSERSSNRLTPKFVWWTKLTNLAACCSVSAMITITTHEAKTHLSRYLAEVEKGREFVIARGNSAVAMLVPLKTPAPRRRPKVGEIKGKPFEFPAAAFAPLTARELKEWGL